MTSVIAGPRTLEQWNDYLAALGKPFDAEDEALIDSLVKTRSSFDTGVHRSGLSDEWADCSLGKSKESN